MALQGVAADDEEERLTPVAIEGGGDVEDKRDEQPDVLHGHSLGVQVEEGRGLVLKQNGAKMGIAAVGRGEILSILASSGAASSSRGGAAAACS